MAGYGRGLGYIYPGLPSSAPGTLPKLAHDPCRASCSRDIPHFCPHLQYIPIVLVGWPSFRMRGYHPLNVNVDSDNLEPLPAVIQVFDDQFRVIFGGKQFNTKTQSPKSHLIPLASCSLDPSFGMHSAVNIPEIRRPVDQLEGSLVPLATLCIRGSIVLQIHRSLSLFSPASSLTTLTTTHDIQTLALRIAESMPNFRKTDDENLIDFFAANIQRNPSVLEDYADLGPGSVYHWSTAHQPAAWRKRALKIDNLNEKILAVARAKKTASSRSKKEASKSKPKTAAKKVSLMSLLVGKDAQAKPKSTSAKGKTAPQKEGPASKAPKKKANMKPRSAAVSYNPDKDLGLIATTRGMSPGLVRDVFAAKGSIIDTYEWVEREMIRDASEDEDEDYDSEDDDKETNDSDDVDEEEQEEDEMVTRVKKEKLKSARKRKTRDEASDDQAHKAKKSRSQPPPSTRGGPKPKAPVSTLQRDVDRGCSRRLTEVAVIPPRRFYAARSGPQT
ncbi:hypothetical protein K438DRAFT_1777734 [Mycena galopus ATCC 62051]|nr:hypothetical protein K438DRAFT_1777734 [Mycena galopus ATCC 62051]